MQVSNILSIAVEELLNLAAILGTSLGPVTANIARNLQEGRVQIRQVIAQKSR